MVEGYVALIFIFAMCAVGAAVWFIMSRKSRANADRCKACKYCDQIKGDITRCYIYQSETWINIPDYCIHFVSKENPNALQDMQG